MHVVNQGFTITPANPPNSGGFQQWRVTQSLPLVTLAGGILWFYFQLSSSQKALEIIN